MEGICGLPRSGCSKQCPAFGLQNGLLDTEMVQIHRCAGPNRDHSPRRNHHHLLHRPLRPRVHRHRTLTVPDRVAGGPDFTRCGTWNRGARHLACTSVPVQPGALAPRCRCRTVQSRGLHLRCKVQLGASAPHLGACTVRSPVAGTYSLMVSFEISGRFSFRMNAQLTRQLPRPYHATLSRVVV